MRISNRRNRHSPASGDPFLRLVTDSSFPLRFDWDDRLLDKNTFFSNQLSRIDMGSVIAAAQAAWPSDPRFARTLLERACRYAPADPAPALALAGLLIEENPPAAVGIFAELAARFDQRDLWLGLAAARRRAGELKGAAEALATALGNHAFSARSELPALADAIARATSMPGWCGVDGEGRLTLGLIAAGRAKPHLVLDGRELPWRGGNSARALPAFWREARRLEVSVAGEPLLGSPISLESLRRVEGFVEALEGALTGWAWLPGDPDRDPVLYIRPVSGRASTLTLTPTENLASPDYPMAWLRRFYLPPESLPAGRLRVCGQDGTELYGSPIDPGLPARAALAATRALARVLSKPRRRPALLPALVSVPARLRGPVPATRLRPQAVDVVVPVYRGAAVTLASVHSLLAAMPKWGRLIVVDDASPEHELIAQLAALASAGRLTLLRRKRNGGFPAAANTGLFHDGRHDVVLLNADTLVPPGWLERLRAAAYAANDIASATPFSNNAALLSYPRADAENPAPAAAEAAWLDRLAWAANGAGVVEIPTGVGFCLYIRRDSLRAVGPLRSDLFAQGYGEENDWCLRARHLGWRHVAATGMFVAHGGGCSFNAGRIDLARRNYAILNELHPGYTALISDFQARDPLAIARRRLDMARWREVSLAAGAVLLVCHARSGGVVRHVRARAQALAAEGKRAIVLRPIAVAAGGRGVLISDGWGEETPNLRFAVPAEIEALADFLVPDRPAWAEIHHLVGHHHGLMGLFPRLCIPYDIVVHDYAFFCPRITLMGLERRYCGEPAVAECEACIADLGSESEEHIAVAELLKRSEAEMAGARRVIAPSTDAAQRLRRHFPALSVAITPWENDPLPRQARLRASLGLRRRIVVIGAISFEKGYEILLTCARDAAARELPLEFALVGYSLDDERLLATKRVTITGPYAAEEVEDLIRAQAACAAFLPSLWPETWSYTLSEAWQAGLDVVAFDLGAPAERIRSSGRGWLIPLGLPAAGVNKMLLALPTN